MNRLDNVRMGKIIHRRADILARTGRQGQLVDSKQGMMERPFTGWNWGPEDQALFDMSKSATADEIAELSLIDAFFGTAVTGFPEIRYRPVGPSVPTFDACKRPLVGVVMGKSLPAREQECGQLWPGIYNPFFWPPPYDMSWFSFIHDSAGRWVGGITTIGQPTTAQPGWPGINAIWGFNVVDSRESQSSSWGSIRIQVNNAMRAERVMHDYPWPNPRATFRNVWALKADRRPGGGGQPWNDFKNFVLQAREPLTVDDMKTSITLTIFRGWEDLVEEIQFWAEHRAKKDKIIGIVKGVLSIVAGAIMAAFAPTMIVSFFDVLKLAITSYDKLQAAVGMQKLARQFQEADAAFAAEVERTATYLDARAKEAEAAVPPSKAEVEALAVVPDGYEVRVEGKLVATKDSPESASAAAMAVSSLGDRIEISFKGKPVGYFIRTKDGVTTVAADIEAQVRAADRKDLVKAVGGDTGWSGWILAIPVGTVLALAAGKKK